MSSETITFTIKKPDGTVQVVNAVVTGSKILTVTSVHTTGVYIPMYDVNLLNNFLSLMKQYGPNLPYVITLNPNSGPGTSIDSRFPAAISTIKNSGLNIIVIGYVYTSYGGRPITAVEADVDSWFSFYPGIQGIMFDEVSPASSADSFYQTITNYVRTKKPVTYVRGNPGGVEDPAKFSIFDQSDVGEQGTYPAETDLQGRTFYPNYPKSKFGFIVHSQPTLDLNWVAMASKYLAWLFVTDAIEPNPYASVPSYFQQLLAVL